MDPKVKPHTRQTLVETFDQANYNSTQEYNVALETLLTYHVSIGTAECSFSGMNPGGYSIYPWVGRCGAAPHTLTLFKTNITDFPTLFKKEFRFLIPCLRHLSCLRQKLINRYPD